MQIADFIKNNLTQRVLSSLALGGWVVGAILLGPYTFLGSGLLIILLTQWELYTMLNVQRTHRAFRIIGLLTSCLLFVFCFSYQKGWVQAEVFLLLLPICLLLLSKELLSVKKPTRILLLDAAITIMGIAYVGGGISMANWLVFQDKEYDYKVLLLLVALITTNDIGAYFVGRAIGKHRLLLHVSPKKSWEGVIGGICSTMGVSLVISTYSGLPLSWGTSLIIAGLVSLTGTIGDLTESLLKRTVGVKDSGKSIPGHGGFLDRLDSTLFVLAFLTPMLVLLHSLGIK